MLAIVVIATLIEVYPRLGWGLAVLAIMAMVANYYDPTFFQRGRITERVITLPRSGR